MQVMIDRIREYITQGRFDDVHSAITRLCGEKRSDDLVAVFELLDQEGIDLNISDGFGQTPLTKCIQAEVITCVQWLLDRRVELHYGFYSPLSLSLSSSTSDILISLLQQGANPSYFEGESLSAIEVCASCIRSKEVLSYILLFCPPREVFDRAVELAKDERQDPHYITLLSGPRDFRQLSLGNYVRKIAAPFRQAYKNWKNLYLLLTLCIGPNLKRTQDSAHVKKQGLSLPPEMINIILQCYHPAIDVNGVMSCLRSDKVTLASKKMCHPGYALELQSQLRDFTTLNR